MNFQDVVTEAREAMSVQRVYGEPYERDGAVVIPAADVRGGGGGGGGEGGEEGGSGSGGGLYIAARPVGAYVIENGHVRWVPATDPVRVAMAALAGVFLLRRLRRR